MTDRIAAVLLGFPAWAVLVAVFALPALESSAFVGFVFPGEIALILGGVLAQQGRVALVAVLAAGFTGAVVGDSIGYLVGRRYGRRVLEGPSADSSSVTTSTVPSSTSHNAADEPCSWAGPLLRCAS